MAECSKASSYNRSYETPLLLNPCQLWYLTLQPQILSSTMAIPAAQFLRSNVQSQSRPNTKCVNALIIYHITGNPDSDRVYLDLKFGNTRISGTLEIQET